MWWGLGDVAESHKKTLYRCIDRNVDICLLCAVIDKRKVENEANDHDRPFTFTFSQLATPLVLSDVNYRVAQKLAPFLYALTLSLTDFYRARLC